jgi:hypothetical protein
MGYRSDVQMTIQGPEEELLTTWAAFRLKNPWVAPDSSDKDPCVEHMSITKNETGNVLTLCFVASHWKWYDGYPDVDRIMQLWKHFAGNETASTSSGIFIRIGEENTDIEEKTFGDSPWELASLVQSISSDYSVDLENDIRSKL